MTGKHPPSQPGDRADWFDDELDDDRFNDVIEGMIRGDRRASHDLDPAMSATVDQLFGWAKRSGFSQEPPSESLYDNQARNLESRELTISGAASSFPKSIQVPDPDAEQPVPVEGKLHSITSMDSGRSRSIPSRLLAALSGLAAVALLTLAGYGAFSLATNRGDEQESADAPVVAIATELPLPTPYPTLALDPDASYAISPLTRADCAADPRSRQELLDILSTPPGAEHEPTVPSLVAGETTRDEINTLLRSWWACHVFGLTWQQTAYESEQYIRMAVYPDSSVMIAFSPSTLDELLDARAQVDARRVSMLPAATVDILTVVPDSEVRITPSDGDGPPTVLATVSVVSASTGNVQSGTWEMTFIYEDGAWKIGADDPRQLSPLAEW